MPRFLALALLFALAACGGSDDADTSRYGEKPDYGVKPGGTATPTATADAPAQTGGFSAQDLVGTWTTSLFISPQEAARLSEEPLEPGTEVEATAQGTVRYLANSGYDAQGEATYRFRAQGEELAVRFNVRTVGTWEYENGLLIETIEDISVTPLDSQTAEFLNFNAAFVEDFGQPGDVTVSTVLSAGPNTVTLQDEETGLQATLTRAG
jgi:hypothetical protein